MIQRTLLDFPRELILLIIFLLDGASVVNVGKTCRAFRRYCKKTNLWKELCRIECPDQPVARFKGHYRLCWKYNIYIQEKNDLVPELLQNITDNKNRYKSVRELRRMLCWPFDQPEIPTTIVNILLPVIQDGDLNEKIETVRCIANMAANAPAGSNKFTELAKPLTEILVIYTDPILTLETLGAIRNIAGDSLHNRDFILNLSTLVPIVTIMKREMQQKREQSTKILNAAAMTITALCRKKPAPPITKVIILLPVLIELIFYENEELLGNVLWAYSGITEQSSKPHINAVAEQKLEKSEKTLTQRLIELVLRPSKHLYYPAMRVIGNILVSDAEEHTKMFLKAGILTILEKFLHHSELTMRKESIWSLSNIAATSPECIQAIIDFGLFPTVIKKIGEDDPFVRKEAAFTIANSIWKGTPQQARIAVQAGCLPKMIELAQTASTSEQVLQLVIETFENLLKPEIPDSERTEYAAMINNTARSFLYQVVNTPTNSTASINLANNVLRKLPVPTAVT